MYPRLPIRTYVDIIHVYISTHSSDVYNRAHKIIQSHHVSIWFLKLKLGGGMESMKNITMTAVKITIDTEWTYLI